MYATLFGALLTLVFLRLARRRGHIVPRQRAERIDAIATLAR